MARLEPCHDTALLLALRGYLRYAAPSVGCSLWGDCTDVRTARLYMSPLQLADAAIPAWYAALSGAPATPPVIHVDYL